MTKLLFLALLFLITFAYAALRGAPWVPTWKNDVQRFLRLANLKRGEVFYDLGCGDGRLVRAAARAGAKATGLEVSLFPYLIAIIRQIFIHDTPPHLIHYKDFWSANLSDADVVYVFLMERFYLKLIKKFERELKPGTRVISYVWPLPEWTPDIVDTVPGQPIMYLYTVPTIRVDTALKL